MSQITILLLYLLAAAAFTMSRLPRFDARSRPLFLVACILAATGIGIHGEALFSLVLPKFGFDLNLGNAASMIGLELAIIGLIAAIEPTLRGMSGGLIFLAALTVILMGPSGDAAGGVALAWQVRAHVLIALLSYGLLTVGTIVALFALVQERRLQAAKLSPVNQLFAPLETTEKLLFAVAGAGFAGLTLAIASGSSFVTDLIEQHLRDLCPSGCSLEVQRLHAARPVLLPVESPAVLAARSAVKEAYGKDPVFIREGGSIPVVEVFGRVLDAPVVLFGFGRPDDGAHGPNEKIHLDDLRHGMEASAWLWSCFREAFS